MVTRAREKHVVPVIHLHGRVGWYADDGKVYDMNADRPHNATLGTPVVLYPDPEKQPTRDVLVADLWTEFTDAAQSATHILVVGHSLHDPQVFFLREALGHVPRSRPLGLAALAILAVATAPVTLIVGIAASTAVLVAVAIADTVRQGDQAPSRSA